MTCCTIGLDNIFRHLRLFFDFTSVVGTYDAFSPLVFGVYMIAFYRMTYEIYSKFRRNFITHKKNIIFVISYKPCRAENECPVHVHSTIQAVHGERESSEGRTPTFPTFLPFPPSISTLTGVGQLAVSIEPV